MIAVLRDHRQTRHVPHDNADNGRAEQYLTTRELAERWRMSPGSLRNARCSGKGIRYLRLGGAVRYPLSAVIEHERKHMVGRA